MFKPKLKPQFHNFPRGQYVNPYIPTQTHEEDETDHMQSPG